MNDDEPVAEYPYDSVKRILEASCEAHGDSGGGKSKIHDHAVQLLCELLRIIANEAFMRANNTREEQMDDTIEVTHLERNIPQFLLDFA